VTDRVKIFCNTCKGETNHDIKSTHDQSYHEEIEDNGHKYLGYYESTEFRFLICRGCDSATLEEKWTGSGMQDHNGNDIYSYIYHPARKNVGERDAKNFQHVDKKLQAIYKEIVVAFQQNLGVVTAMGIRALFEGICVAEGINDKVSRNLTGKIKQLRKLQKVPDDIIDALGSVDVLSQPQHCGC